MRIDNLGKLGRHAKLVRLIDRLVNATLCTPTLDLPVVHVQKNRNLLGI